MDGATSAVTDFRTPNGPSRDAGQQPARHRAGAKAWARCRAAGMAVGPDPAAIVLPGRARNPSARPLGRSRIVVEGRGVPVNLS